MTQEELGKLVFVSKQAISKWENGRTMPDLETIRKLCEILHIDHSEILGGAVVDAKKSRRYTRISAWIAAFCLLLAMFFVLDVPGFVDRRTQSSVAYVTVYEDGELISNDNYSVSSHLPCEKLKNAYKFKTNYGEVSGVIKLDSGCEIEYGFINTNNWHNIQIRIDIESENGALYAKQTVTYETDDGVFQVHVTEASADGQGNISVFRKGI